MVNRSQMLDGVFAALADRTRRSMVARLARGPATIGELGEPFAMTKPAVTKHVKVLERAGLLTRDIQGRIHRCAIDPRPLSQAQRWVTEVRAFWEQRLDDLADYLATVQRKPKR
ncbi:MAG TPA: metalloregulator ArsR/SmtB family transcription factor [Planctomycetota bacterium]|nr:metalloregulator ArsR/SmtB family transcription factor [Planctomycetota bacterium]